MYRTNLHRFTVLVALLFLIEVQVTAAPVPINPPPTNKPASANSTEKKPAVAAKPSSPSPLLHPTALSPTEWQKINTARAEVMKANPDLLKKSDDLAAEMKAFQQKLDAAMVKANPNIAPTVTKLEHRENAPSTLMPSVTR